EAVLALREPYQSVIVLAYYEGLSAADIARRRNVPAGTVRAQLSRAFELLRATLDAETDGGRSAWSAALAGLGSPSRPAAVGTSASTSTTVLAACAIVAGGLVAPIAWWAIRTPSGTASASVPVAIPAAPGIEHIAPTEQSDPESNIPAQTRAPVASARPETG